MKANEFTLLTKAEYFRDLAQLVARTGAGERVALAAMGFAPNIPLIGDIARELEAAAQRGVEVYFCIDAYNFLKAGPGRPGPLWPRAQLPKNLPGKYRDIVDVLEKITAAGGHCAIINMPNRPFSPMHGGRSHIKTAVIGDTVYIGGCNLDKPKQLDVMARWRDHEAADWTFNALQRMVKEQDTLEAFGRLDTQLEIDPKTSLLIDAGKPGRSLILDNAYGLIDQAQERIFITCQYFPGGMTARHLKAALDRGVQVTICYSHPSVHGLEAPGHYLYALSERARLPAELFAHRLARGLPKMHAKVLCTEKAAMLGSHNYVIPGVRWGTAEIALRCDMPEFSSKLQAFTQEQIDSYRPEAVPKG